MKKYTQAEFDNFEIIDGIKQCPSGDYSEIKKFAEWCSFAEWCKAISPFWSFLYEIPMETIGKILIPFPSYPFWKERFNLDFEKEYTIVSKLPEILKRTDLTKNERRILESWKGEN